MGTTNTTMSSIPNSDTDADVPKHHTPDFYLESGIHVVDNEKRFHYEFGVEFEIDGPTAELLNELCMVCLRKLVAKAIEAAEDTTEPGGSELVIDIDHIRSAVRATTVGKLTDHA